MFVITHFISYFYENKYLLWLLSITALAIIVFSILKLHIQNIIIPFTLFSAGVLLLLFLGTDMTVSLSEGLRQMRNIVGLLIIVPMIRFVLMEENYINSVLTMFHSWMNTGRKFYAGIVGFTQIIAYFLLFGAIPMLYDVVNSILKNKQGVAWEHFKSTALLRGFALSVIWAISIPSFAYVVEIMEAPLGTTILQGFGIAVVGSIIAVIFFHYESKRYGVDITAGLQSEIDNVLKHENSKEETKRLTIEFMLLFITLVASIFTGYSIFDLELLVLIPLIVLVWITAYYFIKRKPKRLTQEMYRYFSQEAETQGYQLSMMLGVGVFIYALNHTGFAQFVVDGIYTVQEALPFLNMLYFLPFIIIILGFFGLGPMTVMVLVGGILETVHLPYPPELTVLAITSGSAISILLSPLIMPVIIISSANKLSPLKNGLGFNWKFAIVLYVVVQIYIQLMII
jgi:hypothetical protein